MIRYKKYPRRVRAIGCKRIVFYQAESDGSPVLKENQAWWKVCGLLYKGQYEFVFRKRGMRSL